MNAAPSSPQSHDKMLGIRDVILCIWLASILRTSEAPRLLQLCHPASPADLQHAADSSLKRRNWARARRGWWDKRTKTQFSFSAATADHVQSTIKSIFKTMCIFYLVNFAVQKYFSQPKQPVVPKFDSESPPSGLNQEYNPIPQSIAPIWPTDSSIDIKIYVSHSLAMPGLRHVQKDQLVLEESNFKVGDWNDGRVVDTTIRVPREVQHNSTLWAHLYVGLHGSELDPSASEYDVKSAYHIFRPLNQYLAKKKVVKTKKLLGGEVAEDDGDEISKPKGAVFASYYHPNFTMSFIPDSGVTNYPRLQPAIRQHLTLEATGARDASGQNGWYYPILFVNTFWQLRDHMTELNSTVKTLPIHIDLNNLKNWKFAIYASMDESIKQNQRNAANGGSMPAGGDGSEFEEMKRILVDTNVYLLSTTVVVSVLHMIFEMLAFKSDVVRILNPRTAIRSAG